MQPQPAPAAGGSDSPCDQLDLQAPSQVWTAVLNAVQNKPALAGWVRRLQLLHLDERSATVAPLPGHRELLGFLDERRRDQLAQLIQGITGQRIRVQVTEGDGTDAAGSGARSTSGNQSALQAQQRQEALNLPLVKQVMQMFQATVLEVRPLDQATPSPAAPADSAIPKAPSLYDDEGIAVEDDAMIEPELETEDDDV